MASTEATKVLAVVGDPAFARVVTMALAHPRLQVESAVSEQAIVAALTTRQFDVVIVGGRVGKRGPLVLCDVVRIRQTGASVVVLVRDETDDASLRDHQSRQLARVHYIDLRGVAPGLDQGIRVRATALGVLGVDEDPESGARWPEGLTAPAEPEPAAAPAPVEAAPAAPPQAASSEVAEPPSSGEPDLAGEEAAPADGALPFLTDAVTDDDITFAARMVSRSRGIDFRAPLAALPLPEGTDRATAKLRDRVRELERHLAHLAHVYAGRTREYDGAAERIAGADRKAEGLEQELARTRDQAAQERDQWRQQRADRDTQIDAQARRIELLEARVREATDEVARLREESRVKDAGFAGMLKQAQDAFSQLRDQSSQALAFYERRVAEQDKQAQSLVEEAARARESHAAETAALREEHRGEAATLKAAHQEELAGLKGAHQDELASLKAAHVEEASSLRGSYQQASDRLADATERLAKGSELEGELTAARAGSEGHRALADRAQARVNELEGQLVAARGELERLKADHADRLSEIRRAGEALAAEKAAALAQAVERGRQLEAALELRGQTLSERERELTATATRLDAKENEVRRLASELEDRTQELARARKVETDLRDEVERVATRALDTALDARLVAIEEHARLAAEASAHHGEFLAGLDQRTAKQASLVDRLNRVIEPTETSAGSHVTPVVAARRLAERMRPEESLMGRLWRKLREPPYVVAVPVLLVVLAVSVLLVVMSSGGDEVPARPPAPAHAPGKTSGKQGAGKADAAAKHEGEAAAKRDAKAEPKPAEPKPAEPKPAEAVDAKAKGGEPPVDAAKAGDPKKPAAAGAGAVPATTVAAARPPSPDDLPIVLTPDERRNLRKRMFDSYKVKKWDDAAEAGLLLRAGGKLDWEAALNLAQALRFANRTNDAIEAFKVFLADFPDNKYAPEAKATLEKLAKH